MKLKVAVCIATYNGSAFLDQLLESIESQVYENLIIVVRDDSSNDDSPNIIRKFRDKSKHKYLIISDGFGNLGVAKNFQTIINAVEADMYCLADQDDVWDSNKILKFVSTATESELWQTSPSIIYSNYHVKYENLNISIDVDVSQEIGSIIYENFIPGCTIAFNRQVKNIYCGMVCTDYIHDWVLALIVYYSNGTFIKISDRLITYRQHGSNQIGHVAKKKKIFKFSGLLSNTQNFIEATLNAYSCIKYVSAGAENRSMIRYALRRIWWRVRCAS